MFAWVALLAGAGERVGERVGERRFDWEGFPKPTHVGCGSAIGRRNGGARPVRVEDIGGGGIIAALSCHGS